MIMNHELMTRPFAFFAIIYSCAYEIIIDISIYVLRQRISHGHTLLILGFVLCIFQPGLSFTEAKAKRPKILSNNPLARPRGLWGPLSFFILILCRLACIDDFILFFVSTLVSFLEAFKIPIFSFISLARMNLRRY